MSPRRANITGVQLSGQIPILEHVRFGHTYHWQLWLSYNPNRTAGTYLELLDNGAIFRHTIEPTGEIQTAVIAPPRGIAKK